MSGLRVLITNCTLNTRTGTEIYVRDLAIALCERGHTPIVYSPELGEIAEEIRERTIPVVDDLGKVSQPPDIIHGQHNIETMTALLHFPQTPAAFFFHDNLSWHDVPPKFPRILRYVAVDETCLDRLLYEHGIRPERACVILNSVDLEKFQPRASLPEKPKRALLFSNSPTHVEAVRAACKQTGLELDIIGAANNKFCNNPETILGQYDLVFAKAKAALEAMAVGTSVVLCDMRGCGPMVTTADLSELRRLNFGHRTLRNPLEPNVIAREIASFDARDAAEVSKKIRSTAGLCAAVDEIIELYKEVIAESKNVKEDTDAERMAVADFLQELPLREALKAANKKLTAYDNLSSVRWSRRLMKIPFLGAVYKKLSK
jgi:hypothetical protein